MATLAGAVAIGGVLGAGLLLCISPVLWPAGQRRLRQRVRLLDLIDDRLALAGLSRVTPSSLVSVSALLGLVAAGITFALLPVVALAVAAGLAASLLPLGLVNARAHRRRRANRALWPDVVDHLVSGVRSGLALPEAVAVLAEVGPSSLRASFVEFDRDYRNGGNFSRSIDRLKHRIADPVADRILETLRMSREVGGTELTRVLRNLSAYLRQEAGIRAEVEARQSWVVNAARLGAVAPWVVLVLLASRPEAALAYNSAAGIGLIVVGLVVTVIAYQLMLAIGLLPEERRWFQ